MTESPRQQANLADRPEPAEAEPLGCGLLLLAVVGLVLLVAWYRRLDVALFFLVGEVLLAVHEAGHWLAASLVGIPVRRVVVGLGPPFLAFRVGCTQVSMAALPLWGYTECYEATAGGYEALSGRKAGGEALAEEPGSATVGSVDRYVSRLRRLLFFLGGVGANFVVGIGLIWTHGYVDIEGRRVPAPVVGAVRPFSSADMAGLREGDRVQAVGSQAGPGSWSDLVRALVTPLGSADPPALTLHVRREERGRGGSVSLALPWTPPLVSEEVRQEGAYSMGEALGFDDCPSWLVEDVEDVAGLLLHPGDEVLEARWRDLRVSSFEGASPYAVYVLFRLAGRDHAKVEMQVRRVDGTVAWVSLPGKGAKWSRLTGITLEARVRRVRHDSPAWRAGLRPDDRVSSVNGRRVEGRTDLLESLYQASARPSRLDVERNGREATVDLPPEPRQRGVPTRGIEEGWRASVEPPLDGLGVVAVTDAVRRQVPGLEAGDRLAVPALREGRLWWVKADGSEHSAPWRGTSAFWSDDWQRVAPFTFDSVRDLRPPPTLADAVSTTGRLAWWAVRSLGDLVPSMWKDAHQGYQAQDAGRMTGRVRDRPWSFLFILALVSIFLGVVNILPLPPLDGSRVVVVVLEMLLRRPLGLQADACLGCLGRFLILGVSLLGLYLMVRDLVMALFH